MHNNDPLPTVLVSEQYDYVRLHIRCINCLNLPQQKIAESHFPGSSHQQLWITSFAAIETLLKKCFRNITEIKHLTRIQLAMIFRSYIPSVMALGPRARRRRAKPRALK